MDAKDFGGFFKTVLPWIGAAATGNVPALVTLAASAVSTAIGGSPIKPDAASIIEAVTSATPDQLLALKAGEQDFMLHMQALGFQHIEALEAAAAGDRASARQREEKTGDTATPRWLAVFAVVCFVGLVIAVLRGVEPATGMKDTFLILVGAAIATYKDVYGYYFGSSSGSRDNQEAIRTIAKSE